MGEGIPFIDAHIHLWELQRIRYAWLSPPFSNDGPNGDVAPIADDYRPADYRSDMAGWAMTGAVHVEAGADPSQALDETRWLEGLADDSGIPTAIVAFAGLEAPDAASRLAAQAAFPRVRGIRQILNWHPDPNRTYTPADLSRDPSWRAGYALLAQHGFSFDLQCYPGQMPGLAPLIDAHPDTPVIVNHCGMPVLGGADGVAMWRAGLRALAALPHVAIKLSGFGFIRRDWTVDTIRPLVLEVIDLFGADRCMFASDAPTDTLFAPLAATRELFEAILEDFSDTERRALCGRNANRIYRLGLEL